MVDPYVWMFSVAKACMMPSNHLRFFGSKIGAVCFEALLPSVVKRCPAGAKKGFGYQG